MGVVVLKSTTMTNRDAVPRVINDGRLEKASMKISRGFVTAGAADSIGSTYVLASVASTAMVSKVTISCGAVTSAAADVGAYYPTTTAGVAGAVISAAFFGSAVSIATALSNSDITNESGTYTLAKQEQPLWQALGIATDPGGFIDIVATLTAAATASAVVGIQVHYQDNGS